MPLPAPPPPPDCSDCGNPRPGRHALLDDGSHALCLPCVTMLLVRADEAGSRITVMVTAAPRLVTA